MGFFYLTLFLGGPEKSEWDGEFISKCNQFDYFSPIRDSYTPESQAERARQRTSVDACVYCYTPEMVLPYFLCELIDDSNKRPDYTYFLTLKTYNGLTDSTRRWTMIQGISSLVSENGVTVYTKMSQLVNKINELIAAL